MRISDWSSDVCSSDLRRHSAGLATIGERLTGITSQLTEIDDVGAERRLLDELMTLSSEIEDVAAATTYRFSAARAYYALVLRRVEELREQRVEGLQTLSEFVARRLAPAMRTRERSEEGRAGEEGDRTLRYRGAAAP